jgi:hypothetical protein
MNGLWWVTDVTFRPLWTLAPLSCLCCCCRRSNSVLHTMRVLKETRTKANVWMDDDTHHHRFADSNVAPWRWPPRASSSSSRHYRRKLLRDRSIDPIDWPSCLLVGEKVICPQRPSTALWQQRLVETVSKQDVVVTSVPVGHAAT